MNPSRRAALFALFPLLLAVLWSAFFPRTLLAEPYGSLLYDLGAPFFCSLAAFLLRHAPKKANAAPRVPRRAAVIACVAAFAVAVNNLPWIALFTGEARLTAPLPAYLLFACLCLSVAAVEELIFRGILLPVLCRRMAALHGGRLLAVLVSSALFGLSHLCNLFFGADPGATLLQVSYSFLIGCAAAVLYLLTHRIGLPILFHAVYNFGGLLLSRLGEGKILNVPTVILTVAIGASAAVLIAFSFICGERVQENTPKISKN